MTKTHLETNVFRHKANLELKELNQNNASMVAKYENIGFDGGGEYESLVHMICRFDIEFGSRVRLRNLDHAFT
jgi:hypothetical protein